MRIIGAIFVILTTASLVACDETTPDKQAPAEITITGVNTKVETDAVAEAFRIFKDQCPKLFTEYWTDVVSAEGELKPMVKDVGNDLAIKFPMAKAYGWSQSLQLRIRMSDAPSAIPASVGAAFQTLFFDLGGGRSPGIFAFKDASAKVCEFKKQSAKGAFHPVEALTVLDTDPRLLQLVEATDNNAETWQAASGNIWSGVKLYFGPHKRYVGEVVGGTDRESLTSGELTRGVVVKMAGETLEWKNRDAIVLGAWYIRRDDPALNRQQWRTIN